MDGLGVKVSYNFFDSDLIMASHEILVLVTTLTIEQVESFNCTLEEFKYFLDGLEAQENFKHLRLFNNKYEKWPKEYRDLFFSYLSKFHKLEYLAIAHNNYEPEANYDEMCIQIASNLANLPHLSKILLSNPQVENIKDSVVIYNTMPKYNPSLIKTPVGLAETMLKYVKTIKGIDKLVTWDLIKGRSQVLYDLLDAYKSMAITEIEISLECLANNKSDLEKLFACLTHMTTKDLKSINFSYVHTSPDMALYMQKYLHELPKFCPNINALILNGCLKASAPSELRINFCQHLANLNQLQHFELMHAELQNWSLDESSALIKVLHKLAPKLHTLNLALNDIYKMDHKTIEELFTIIKNAHVLKTLRIERNYLSVLHPILMKKIAKMLERNNGLRQIYIYDLDKDNVIHHAGLKKLSPRLYGEDKSKIEKFRSFAKV